MIPISEQITAMRVQIEASILSIAETQEESIAEIKEMIAETKEIIAETKESIAKLMADVKEISSRVSSKIFVNVRSKSHILVLTAQIHIHVLLDKAREKIVKSHDVSREDLCNSCEIYEIKQTIASTHSMPGDLTNFNYEFKIKSISRLGWQQYSFVHQEPEGAECQVLQQLYQFVFNEDHDINFGELDGE